MIIMSNDLTWKEAVRKAIKKVVERHDDPQFTRRLLIDEEMDYIEKMTETEGKTPEQTLSRVLQELRDEGMIEFLDDDGRYRLK